MIVVFYFSHLFLSTFSSFSVFSSTNQVFLIIPFCLLYWIISCNSLYLVVALGFIAFIFNLSVDIQMVQYSYKKIPGTYIHFSPSRLYAIVVMHFTPTCYRSQNTVLVLLSKKLIIP